MCLQDDNDEDYDPNDDVKTENKMDTSDTPIDYNEDGENDDMLEDEEYIMPEKKKKKVKSCKSMASPISAFLVSRPTPLQKWLINPGPMRSYTLKENRIGSAVSDNLRYRQTNILLFS